VLSRDPRFLATLGMTRPCSAFYGKANSVNELLNTYRNDMKCQHYLVKLLECTQQKLPAARIINSEREELLARK